MVLVKGMLKYLSWALGIIALVLIFSLFFGISLLLKNGQNKTNQEMIVFFNSHKKEFFELNANMLKLQKAGIEQIRKEWMRPENLQFNHKNELEVIRRRMDDLGITGIDSFSGDIDYITYTWGLSVTGGSKGYRFSLKNPDRKTMDMRDSHGGFKERSVPSSGSWSSTAIFLDHWYIFEEYED